MSAGPVTAAAAGPAAPPTAPLAASAANAANAASAANAVNAAAAAHPAPAAVARAASRRRPGAWLAAAVLAAALLAQFVLWAVVPEAGAPDRASPWHLAGLLVVALLAAGSVRAVAAQDGHPAWATATAALFGLWVLYFWQIGVTLFNVPRVLLPSPWLIAQMLLDRWDTLAADFVQTVLKAVLVGWALGSGLGFAVAVAIDRAPFLQRGLLPIANLTSTVPLVAVAPIMVMWFGFEWPSKAAVVVLMTFFPMLVSTLAGLQATGRLERELMHSYAAGYARTLLWLRLPVAMPFIFNALKINATLALIGAIVAEFFGSPTVGLGFRISTEAARMNMALVWGAIVVAAVSGSVAYALLVQLERRVAFWHPSVRRS